MDKGNGNTVLLTVIGVATLLVALVGATFAYFTAAVNNDTAQSISLTTATSAGLVYTGTRLSLENAIPGKFTEGSFTVVSDGGNVSDFTYDLNIKISANSFCDDEGTGQLMVTFGTPASSGNASGTAPTLLEDSFDFTEGQQSDSVATAGAAGAGTTHALVNDARIKPGETHTYSMKVEFVELNSVQDTNQGANFYGYVEISNPTSVQ